MWGLLVQAEPTRWTGKLPCQQQELAGSLSWLISTNQGGKCFPGMYQWEDICFVTSNSWSYQWGINWGNPSAAQGTVRSQTQSQPLTRKHAGFSEIPFLSSLTSPQWLKTLLNSLNHPTGIHGFIWVLKPHFQPQFSSGWGGTTFQGSWEEVEQWTGCTSPQSPSATVGIHFRFGSEAFTKKSMSVIYFPVLERLSFLPAVSSPVSYSFWGVNSYHGTHCPRHEQSIEMMTTFYISI